MDRENPPGAEGTGGRRGYRRAPRVQEGAGSTEPTRAPGVQEGAEGTGGRRELLCDGRKQLQERRVPVDGDLIGGVASGHITETLCGRNIL